MKRNFKVNKKVTFTDEGELVQQWPQVQKSVSKDTEEEEDAGGINLDKAKERLQEEDKFDKEEYRKKIKAKRREKRLKEREARREASKKQAKAKDEEEAFLDWSNDDNDGFDPSILPDPDKYRSPEESDNEDMENKIRFLGCEARGILAPRPGIESTTPALEGDVLTTGPPVIPRRSRQ